MSQSKFHATNFAQLRQSSLTKPVINHGMEFALKQEIAVKNKDLQLKLYLNLFFEILVTLFLFLHPRKDYFRFSTQKLFKKIIF